MIQEHLTTGSQGTAAEQASDDAIEHLALLNLPARQAAAGLELAGDMLKCHRGTHSFALLPELQKLPCSTAYAAGSEERQMYLRARSP